MPTKCDFRVISGMFKGKRLKYPLHTQTHPMGNREKLALFNIVSTDDARVLDIFAGSGALGIEALSRGAEEVVFVEKNPQVARIIKENLAEIGAKAQIFTESAERFSARSEFKGYFDLILADPPYDSLLKSDRPSRASREVTSDSEPKNDIISELTHLAALLRPSGRIALSSPASLAPLALEGLKTLKTHTYAGARLTIYTFTIDKI